MTCNDFAFEVKLALSLLDGCESPVKPVFHERIIQPLRRNVMLYRRMCESLSQYIVVHTQCNGS